MFKVGDRVRGIWHGIECVFSRHIDQYNFLDADGIIRPTRNYILEKRHEPSDKVLDYKIALAEEISVIVENFPHKPFPCIEDGEGDYLWYEILSMAALMSGVFEGEQ